MDCEVLRQTKSDTFHNLDAMMVLCLQHLRCSKALTGLCVRAGYLGYQLCSGWQLQRHRRDRHVAATAVVQHQPCCVTACGAKHVCFVDHHAAQLPSGSSTPGMTMPLTRPPYTFPASDGACEGPVVDSSYQALPPSTASLQHICVACNAKLLQRVTCAIRSWATGAAHWTVKAPQNPGTLLTWP
jgi:hypothetical protein